MAAIFSRGRWVKAIHVAENNLAATTITLDNQTTQGTIISTGKHYKSCC